MGHLSHSTYETCTPPPGVETHQMGHLSLENPKNPHHPQPGVVTHQEGNPKMQANSKQEGWRGGLFARYPGRLFGPATPPSHSHHPWWWSRRSFRLFRFSVSVSGLISDSASQCRTRAFRSYRTASRRDSAMDSSTAAGGASALGDDALLPAGPSEMSWPPRLGWLPLIPQWHPRSAQQNPSHFRPSPGGIQITARTENSGTPAAEAQLGVWISIGTSPSPTLENSGTPAAAARLAVWISIGPRPRQPTAEALLRSAAACPMPSSSMSECPMS
jgi:hypothetical protein